LSDSGEQPDGVIFGGVVREDMKDHAVANHGDAPSCVTCVQSQ
jgi:hypothetical protein